MDAIAKLIAGHRDIREREDLVKKLVTMIDVDAFFWDNAIKVSRFFEVEILNHLDLEEKVLFPVMRGRFSAEKCAIIDELEKEHVILRGKIGAFAALARGIDCSAQSLTRQEIVKYSKEILDIALPHGKREDDELLALITVLFQPEDFRTLETRYFNFLGV